INWVYSSVLLQLLVPPEFLGRVFAFDLAMMTLAASISTFYAGWAQDNFGFGPHEISFSLAATCIVMMAGWLTFMKISAQPNNAITCQDEP
ncbi:MAG TPA: hypothetical protein PKD98_04305, partial [Anaerolineae bacterium]|nr:hypothetical protein [Anaerolineae bacterium]